MEGRLFVVLGGPVGKEIDGDAVVSGRTHFVGEEPHALSFLLALEPGWMKDGVLTGGSAGLVFGCSWRGRVRRDFNHPQRCFQGLRVSFCFVFLGARVYTYGSFGPSFRLVEFANREDAQRAIRELTEQPLIGRPVFIREVSFTDASLDPRV